MIGYDRALEVRKNALLSLTICKEERNSNSVGPLSTIAIMYKCHDKD